MTLPRLRAPGAAKAAEPCFLADVIPANLLSSLTTEAGVSFGLPHCKERVEAWSVKLEINSSDKNYVMFKIPATSLFETNLYCLHLSPKG